MQIIKKKILKQPIAKYARQFQKKSSLPYSCTQPPCYLQQRTSMHIRTNAKNHHQIQQVIQFCNKINSLQNHQIHDFIVLHQPHIIRKK